MKVKFISYADANMSYSLKRIGRQARRLGIFDEVILYTPEMLPDEVNQNPLMQYSRGGGYWVWKPFIINETLKSSDDEDIVVYIDAGCTLHKGAEWVLFFYLLEKYDTLCFQYHQIYPEWSKWGSKYPTERIWTKKSALEFLISYTGDHAFVEEPQIWGGCLMFKKRKNQLLHDWLSIVMENPEIIMDPTKEERRNQDKDFAGHRHDQSVLTALVLNDKDCVILPEISENDSLRSFVNASRIRAKNLPECLFIEMKHYLRKTLGGSRFESLKAFLK